MDSYLFFYVESNIVCSLFLIILLVRTLRGVDWQLKQTYFARLLFFYVIYFVIDTVWIFFEAGIFTNRWLRFVFNLLSYILGSFSFYYWYIYSEIVQEDPFVLVKKNRFIVAIPLLVLFAIAVVFLFVMEIFYPDSKNLPFYNYYYTITTITPMFYVFIAFIKSIKRARIKENASNKSVYIMMGCYPVVLFIGAVIQVFFLYLPILCYVVVIDLLCVYLNSLDTLISIDALTKLNNRNQFNRFLVRAIKENNGKKWVFFLDVDKFKKINDTYGHMEGDKALVLVADVLRQSCKKGASKYFIARYGGDEFIIMANGKDIDDPKKLKDKIKHNLENACEKNNIQYKLTVSIGVALVNFNKEGVQAGLEKADKELYKIKQMKAKKVVLAEERN